MQALYDIKLDMEERYKDLIRDLLKFSTVYFVAAFAYCQIHPKVSKLVENNIIELYCLVMLGVVSYHLVVNVFVQFT